MRSIGARRAAHRSRWHQDGSAVILVLALAAIVAALGSLAVALGSIAVDRHRAASAADLSALAAARHAAQGAPTACRRAAHIAQAAHADLVSCQIVGQEALVEVAVRPTGPLVGLGESRSWARAGPVAP